MTVLNAPFEVVFYLAQHILYHENYIEEMIEVIPDDRDKLIE